VIGETELAQAAGGEAGSNQLDVLIYLSPSSVQSCGAGLQRKHWQSQDSTVICSL
jgi:hypothetical protein